MSKVERSDDENMSLTFQVESLTKENEHLKLEYQKLLDSIKKTRTQTQKEINALIENVNQNKYAYVDVRNMNQDLLITIFELKEKLKIVEKGKSVKTKFEKPVNLGKPISLKSLINESVQKSWFVPNFVEKQVVSKPVTSQTLHKKEKEIISNTNIIALGMYKIKTKDKQETHEKTIVIVSYSTQLKGFISVRRP
ncbi:hypothetical protein Tco_1258136 [Tanacetum coccineum]